MCIYIWFRKVQHQDHATTMFQHDLLHTNAKLLSSKGGWFDVICTFFGHNGTPQLLWTSSLKRTCTWTLSFRLSQSEKIVVLCNFIPCFPMFSYGFPCFPMFSQWFYWLLSDPPRDPTAPCRRSRPRHRCLGCGTPSNGRWERWYIPFRSRWCSSHPLRRSWDDTYSPGEGPKQTGGLDDPYPTDMANVTKF